MHLEQCEQLTVTTRRLGSVLRTKPIDICALLGSILTMLGVENSLKLCVGKN